jgi:hypothetical protein
MVLYSFADPGSYAPCKHRGLDGHRDSHFDAAVYHDDDDAASTYHDDDDAAAYNHHDDASAAYNHHDPAAAAYYYYNPAAACHHECDFWGQRRSHHWRLWNVLLPKRQCRSLWQLQSRFRSHLCHGFGDV